MVVDEMTGGQHSIGPSLDSANQQETPAVSMITPQQVRPDDIASPINPAQTHDQNNPTQQPTFD